jgi:hypothetical protein
LKKSSARTMLLDKHGHPLVAEHLRSTEQI